MCIRDRPDYSTFFGSEYCFRGIFFCSLAPHICSSDKDLFQLGKLGSMIIVRRMEIFSTRAFWTTALAGFLTLVGRGDDWPCYRGPQHNGTSREKGWLDQWPDQGPKTLWKATLG